MAISYEDGLNQNFEDLVEGQLDEIADQKAEGTFAGPPLPIPLAMTMPPIVTSLTTSVNVMGDDGILDRGDIGTGTFTITIDFDQAMNTTVLPAISFPTLGEDPGALFTFTGFAWSNGNQTYTLTFTVNDLEIEIPDVDIQVSGGQNSSGDVMSSVTIADVFSIDMDGDAGDDLSVSFDDVNGFIDSSEDISAVDFTVSGLDADAAAIVTFTGLDAMGMAITQTVNVPASGGATVDLTGFAEGSVSASISSTDNAGNIAVGTGDSSTIDSSADLDGNLLLTISDTAVNAADGNSLSFDVAGLDTDLSSAMVTFSDGVNMVMVDVSAGDGSYNVDLSALDDGNITSVLGVTDGAGNTASDNGADIDLDRTADAGIGLFISIPDTNIDLSESTMVGFSISDLDADLVSAIVTFTDGVDSVTVDVSGGDAPYSVDLSSLADGTITSSLAVTDDAGNTAGATGADITLDTDVPDAPVITSISTDSGASTSDGITNDNEVTIFGTAEANAFVEVFSNGMSIGIVQANGMGDWSIDYPDTIPDGADKYDGPLFTPSGLADGTYSLTAVTTDAVGNSSPASAVFTLEIDTDEPDAPVISATITNDAGGSDSDGSTTDATPTLSITAEAGSVVEVYIDGFSAGFATETATAGTFSFTSTALTAGSHNFTAISTDLAGNSSPASAAMTLLIAEAPEITSITDDENAATSDGLNDGTGTVVDGDAPDAATTSGTITFEDFAAGQSHSVTAILPPPGALGNFSVNLLNAATDDGLGAAGWSFSVDNADIDFLDAGDTITQNYIVRITDDAGNETDQAITIIILGTDDVAVITADETGAVSEGNIGDAAVTATGAIAVADADEDDTPSFADVVTSGTYGSLVVNSAGDAWTYTLDQSLVQELDAGDLVDDVITLTDDEGNSVDITITITGTDDDAIITGDTIEAVTEGDIGDAPVTVTGAIGVSDIDADDNPSFANVGVIGLYGILTVNAAGDEWSYTLNQAAAQGLDDGDMVDDVITLTDDEGNTREITITVTGTNDVPVLGVAAVLGDGTEDIAYIVSAAELLQGWSDVDTLDSLSVVNLTASNGAAIVDNMDGTYSVTSAADFNGAVTLSYDVTDGTAPQAASLDFEVLAVSNGDMVTTQTNLNPNVLTAGGDLFIGSGIPGDDGQWVVATDAADAAGVEIGLTASLAFSGGNTVDPADGTGFTFVVPGGTRAGTNQDGPAAYDDDVARWNVNLSIGADTDLDGGALSDRGYTFTISTLDASGDVDTQLLTFTLEQYLQAGVDAMVLTSGERDAILAGSLFQDSINFEWVLDAMPGSDVFDPDAPGYYRIEIAAINDVNGSEELAAHIDVRVNTTPDAMDDSDTTIVEAGTGEAGTAVAMGNVLSNDTDADLLPVADTGELLVTEVIFGGSTVAVAAIGTTSIDGNYGTLVISADGSWTYTLDDDASATQALTGIDTPTETFTYTVTDPDGRLTGVAQDIIDSGTATADLTIGIQGTNDAPVFGYSQDFETGTDGILAPGGYGTITTVASGTNGIVTPDGGDYAIVTEDAGSGPFTRFDGYRSDFVDGLTSEVDVYLDINWTAGEGFDYSVAANGQDGNHQRDFIFHVTQDTSTGQLLVGGSNNTNFAPREDLETLNNYQVTDSGWYTLQHVFRDDGTGVLAVDLNLVDANGNILWTETLSAPADIIATEVGGNRYGWFTDISVTGGLAIDNVELGDFAGYLTEITDGAAGEGTDVLSDMGVIPFTDVELTDTHSVTFTEPVAEVGVPYLGNFSVAVTDDSTNDGEGFVSWTFTVSDSAVDYLAEGEILTQIYTVILDDGTDTVSRDVTITITGTNDAPVLGSAAMLADGTEGMAYVVTEADLLQGWSDVDASDMLSVVNLTASNGAVILDNMDGTYTVTSPADFNGTVTLSYDVTDGLAPQAASLNFEVLADADGDTVITRTSLNSNVLTAGGDLFIGSGIPGDDDQWVVATDAADAAGVEIGLTAALAFSGGQTVDPADASGFTYVVPGGVRAGTNQDGPAAYDDGVARWNVNLSLGADTDLDGGALSDRDYRFEIFTLNDDGTVSSTIAEFTLADYLAAGEASGALAPGGAAAILAGSLYQDSLNFEWLLDAPAPFDLPFDFDPAAPGYYRVEITAENLVNGSDELSAHIDVRVNTTPDAMDDADSTIVEAGDGVAGTAVAMGNVLSNDTDADTAVSADTAELLVTEVTFGGSTVAVAAMGTTSIDGTYGTLEIEADGSWTYTLDDAAAATQALTGADTPTETFTYTVTDPDGRAVGISQDIIDSGTNTADLTIGIQGTNDAPVIDDMTSTTTGSITEFGDIDGAVEDTDFGNFSVDPALVAAGSVAADLAAMVSDASTNFDTSFASIVTELGIEQAFAVIWDHLDDGYIIAANHPELNEAFVRLGVEYADYLENGGTAFLETVVKYTPDNGDADLLPQRVQSLHDNLLGNMWQNALNSRFSGDPALLAILEGLIDAVNPALRARVAFSGNAGVSDADARQFDVDNGYAPIATGTIVFSDVDAGDTPEATVDASAGVLDYNMGGTLPMGLDATAIAAAFSMTTAGEWTYDATALDLNALAEGDTLTISYLVTITDDDGATDTTTVVITINGQNDAPELTGMVATLGDGTEDIGYVVSEADLLAGWSDVDDGAVLEVMNLTASNGAVVTDNMDGTYTIASPADFIGTVTLNYDVSDGAAPQPASLDFDVLAVADTDTVITQTNLNPNVLTAAGDLLIGSGIPGDDGQWVVATDSVDAEGVEIGLTAALAFSGGQTVDPADASGFTYVVPGGTRAGTNQDGPAAFDDGVARWNVNLSLGADTDLNGGALSDRGYTFTISTLDASADVDTQLLTFTLEQYLQAGVDLGSITSGQRDAILAGTIFQDSINFEWVLDAAPGSNVFDPDAPGYYRIEIAAVNSINGSEELAAHIDVRVNTSPDAMDDAELTTIVEAGAGEAGTAVAVGNVLTNDTDADLLPTPDTAELLVTEVTFGGSSVVVAAMGTTSIDGTYGTLVISADGSWTYTLDDNAAATQALTGTDAPTETFTYTVTDPDGRLTGVAQDIIDSGTSSADLTIGIQGTNDGPVITTPMGGNEGAVTEDANASTGAGDLTPMPTGADILVNATSAGIQTGSTITALQDGGFIAIFTDFSSADGSNAGIFGQRYDATGATVGTEFQVNTTTASNQFEPSITTLADGGFVVVFTDSSGEDGNSLGVFAQRYDSIGAAVGTEFQVNTTSTSFQSEPSITALADGGFVITFTDGSGADGGNLGVFGQRYDAMGVAVGTQFQVNTTITSNQNQSSVAALTDGGFVVAFADSSGADGNSTGVFSQRYDAMGVAVGTEFQVNTTTTGGQSDPTVTALTDGGFVVTFTDTSSADGSSFGVFGQRFDAMGVAVGSEFQVNTTTTNNQSTAAVTALSDGGFVVTFTESSGADGNEDGIFGQRFDAMGVAIGNEFLINDTIMGDQNSPEIIELSDGRLAVSFTGDATGSNRDVFVQIIEVPNSGPLPNSTTGQITADDVDAGAVLTFSGDAVGTYGAFVIDAMTGEWTFTLDEMDPDTDALTEGQVVTETFTVTVTDDAMATTTQDVTITITGSNDTATISASAMEDMSVTEAGGDNPAGTLGDPDAGGTLTVADVDTGEDIFEAPDAMDLVGDYGTFTFDEVTGEWTYLLDNTNTDVQALSGGETLTDTLIVSSVDGTDSYDIDVTVNGADDAATVEAGSVLSAQVDERADGAVDENTGVINTTGTILFDDAELPDTHTVTFTPITGPGTVGSIVDYIGTFSSNYTQDSTGTDTGTITWDFDVNAADLDYLDEGETLVQLYEYTIAGDDGAVLTQIITITIVGVEDTADVSGVVTGNVSEGDVGDAPVTATGTLTLSDPDLLDAAMPASFADVTATSGDNGYGTFEMTNGTWIFTLDQVAVQGFSTGETFQDTFTFIASDGATQVITVDINGADDVFVGTPNVDTLTGTEGTDIITGLASDDIINALGGDDYIEGGEGADMIDGGMGSDTASYVNSGSGVTIDLLAGTASGGDAAGDVLSNIENITGSASNDALTGNMADNILEGGDGNDRFWGTDGTNSLIGGNGADQFFGGAGIDFMDGGAGFDTVDYRASSAGIIADLSTGGTGGEAAGDSYAGIERFYGSDFGDTINGSDSNEFLYGEGGNDIINGGGGIDRIFGGDGDDIQRGEAGNDTLYGSAGADQLNGGIGNDNANYSLATSAVELNMATGGTVGDAAGDTYFGIEVIFGSSFNDVITGNAATNDLRGGGGDDVLNGGDGNDRLHGGSGADMLDGGNGIDSAQYSTASAGVIVDLINGGTGGEAAGDSYSSIEWVFGSNFDDIITGDTGNNNLHGNDGADTLNGGEGNDRLFGGDGDDIINGGDGIDTIYGQDGNDTLSGGLGNDFFFGSDGGDSFDGGGDFDTVSYLASSSGIFVNMQSSGSGGDAAGDSYVSIERLLATNFGDTLIGSDGNDVIQGLGGDDVLGGGQGADSLAGGSGVDQFLYDTETSGADVILDFLGGSRGDETINLTNFDTDFDSFAEIFAASTQVGNNVIIDFGGGNTLTLANYSLTYLDSTAFAFPALVNEPLDEFEAGQDVDIFAADALI